MFSKYFYILLILLIVILLTQSNTYDNFNNIENKKDNIPKIIHQTAPANKNKWKKEWITCHDAWKKYFPSNEYTHIMWNDEDLDNFIKNKYSWFYPVYEKYNANIKRIDIARYFILYKYGGIYADMDYTCTKNFYNLLPQDKISISESPYKENEFIQNALMISPKDDPFWMKVVTKAIERVDNPSVLYSTGPKLLTDVYYENVNDINVLPEKLYNPKFGSDDFDSPEVITKHVGTKSWT